MGGAHIIAYLLVLFFALFETIIGVGLLFPGSSLVLLMGALARIGYFDIRYLIPFAAMGALIGDNINFSIGRMVGKKVFDKGFWFIQAKHFKQGEAFFQKHGAKSVLIGRFIPSIKEIVPLVAGALKMKRRKFMFWNTLGVIGWGMEWTLAGYFFAHTLYIARRYLHNFGLAISCLFFLVLSIYFIRRFLKQNKAEIMHLIRRLIK